MTWYLLRTKTNRESIARDNLERQGYESYAPQFVRRFFRARQRVERIDPLFPGYIFLHLRIGIQDLAAAKSTKGVLNVVRFGEDYAVVPHAIIEQIHRRADQQTGLHRVHDPRPKYRSPIRVTEGPMEGLEGIFLRPCGKDRVLILLTVLGHERTVQLPEYAIGDAS